MAITGGPFKGHSARFETNEVWIGTDPSCQVKLVGDPHVSPKHCRLYLTTEGWMVSDQASKSGVYVQGERLVEDKLVDSGAILSVGSSSFRLGDPTEEQNPKQATVKRLTLEAFGLFRQGNYGSAVAKLNAALDVKVMDRDLLFLLLQAEYGEVSPRKYSGLVLDAFKATPWDFPLIDLAIDTIPVDVAHAVDEILAMRTSKPPPFLTPHQQSWNVVAHNRDSAYLNAWTSHREVKTRVEHIKQKNVDADLKKELMTHALRVSPTQMGHLWDAYATISTKLELQPPELFLLDSEESQAFAAGLSDNVVCISAALIEQRPDPELAFILGHELGHVKQKHMFFGAVARMIAKEKMQRANFAYSTGDVDGGDIRRRRALEMYYHALRWQQVAEFTADRFGLIACNGDIDAAMNALTHVSGIMPKTETAKRYGGFTLESFLEQYDEAAREYKIDGVDEEYLGSHPYTALRIRSLQAWRLSAGYHQFLGCS